MNNAETATELCVAAPLHVFYETSNACTTAPLQAALVGDRPKSARGPQHQYWNRLGNRVSHGEALVRLDRKIGAAQ